MNRRNPKSRIRTLTACLGLGVCITGATSAHANLTGSITSCAVAVQTTPYRKVDVNVYYNVTSTGTANTTQLTSVFTGQTGRFKVDDIPADTTVYNNLPYTVFPTAGTYDINSTLFEKAYVTNVLATDTTSCTMPN